MLEIDVFNKCMELIDIVYSIKLNFIEFQKNDTWITTIIQFIMIDNYFQKLYKYHN